MRFALTLSLISLCISALPAQLPVHNGATAILGRWSGTSTCVDKAKDVACKDENVVYICDTANVKRGMIMLHGFRTSGKDLVLMYDLPFAYSDSSRSWSAEYTGRIRIRWTFHIEKNELQGTCVELPSLRLIRKVKAVRS